jgi:spore coat protein H
VTSITELDLYTINIKTKLLRKMENNIWESKPIRGSLIYKGNNYSILLSYRGAFTRKLPKKPYLLQFAPPETFEGNKELHLNAEYNDHSLMRSTLSFEFFESIGVHAPKAKHILLRLNKNLQGIYLQLESFDELFLQKRGLEEGAIFYASNDDANFSLLDPDYNEPKKNILSGYTRKYGTEEDDNKLKEFLYKINITPRNEFESMIHEYLNVENYLKWLVGVICTQNFDGFIQNYTIYENRNIGLYEISPWDYDATWGRDVKGRDLEYDYVPIQGYNTLTARLLDISTIRKQYKELLEEVLSTNFTTAYLEPKIQDLYSQLKPVIAKDPFKKNFVNKFHTEPEYIIEFIKNRNQYLKDHLSELD